MSTVTCGVRRANSTSSSSDCENPTLPAYMTTTSVPIPSSRRYGVMRSWGVMPATSTKFSITCTRSASFAPILLRTLRCRSGDSTTTALARRYVNRSSHEASAMINLLRTAPVAIAASGNTSCTLKMSRVRRSRATIQPMVPSVSGGDIATTASTPRCCTRASRPVWRRTATARTPAITLNATKATARSNKLALDLAGNGWMRVIEPHGVRS